MGIVLLILLALLACWCLRRRRRRRQDERETIARNGEDWEKHGLHRQSADERALGTRRNLFEKRSPHHHKHAEEAAAATGGLAAGTALARHSEASDHRGLLAGANQPDHQRKSGASDVAVGSEHRRSDGSGLGRYGDGLSHNVRDSAGTTSSALPVAAAFTGVRYSHDRGSAGYGDGHTTNLKDPAGVSSSALPAGAAVAGARHSNGNGQGPAPSAFTDTSSSVPNSSSPSGVKRKPLRGQEHNDRHHDEAMLGVGAGLGALAGGAAGYKHHNDQREIERADRAHYVEDNHLYDAHDRQDFADTPTHAPGAMPNDNRPPTPFGLAAFKTGGQQAPEDTPTQQHQSNRDTRRAGTFPDATIIDYNQQYPYHHTTSHPTSEQSRSLQNREFATKSGGEETAYIPYTPSGPYDVAAAAARVPSRSPHSHYNNNNRGPYQAYSPHQHSIDNVQNTTGSTPVRPNRHSAPTDRTSSAAPPTPHQAIGNGRRSLGAVPPPRPPFGEDNRSYSSSSSGTRVPAAAMGAVGRDSPRVTVPTESGNGSGNGSGPSKPTWTPPGAWRTDSSDSSIAGGRRAHSNYTDGGALGQQQQQHTRPAYSTGSPSYSSYATAQSEGATPMYDIPGAFPPGENGRSTDGHGNGNGQGYVSSRPHGPGMVDERRSASGHDSPRSGRKLRFSEWNEEYEIQNSPSESEGIGRAR